jgi:hypothetical protein
MMGYCAHFITDRDGIIGASQVADYHIGFKRDQ